MYICLRKPARSDICIYIYVCIYIQVSYAKEPYKRDDILQKRPIISSIPLTVATS